MISNATMKKLEKQGFTMADMQACWEEMKEVMDLNEFGKLMRVRANNP